MADFVMVKDTTTGQVKVMLGGITEGFIAAGAVTSTKLGDGAVISAKVASGAIGGAHIAAGAMLSANYGKTIAGAHVVDDSLISANYKSGSIGGAHIASEGVLNTNIGSGAVTSGKIASGQIGSNHLASGLSVSASQYELDTTWKAGAAIEQYSAVCLKSGVDGWLEQADAFDPTHMPAIGVLNAAVSSGDATELYLVGRCSWSTTFDAKAGAPLFVGSGGIIRSTPGTASGITQQVIATAMGSSFIMVRPDPTTVFIGA
jgi:hypothetical protein